MNYPGYRSARIKDKNIRLTPLNTTVNRLLCLSLLCLPVLAGCSGKHSYRFLTENDSYHPVERPDANYTSGLSLIATPSKAYWKGDNKFVDKLNVLQWSDKSYPVPMTLEYGLGQVFYTPDDVSLSSLDEIDRNGRPLRLDRPYAGFLFLQGAIHNHYGQEYDWTTDMRRSVTAKVGLTGNGSLAEELHTTVHESRNLTIPEGWGMQIGQVIGATLGVEQRNRVLALIGKRWGVDVMTNIKASLGNIYSGIDAGVTLRVGLNLPRGYHQSSIIEPFEAMPRPLTAEEAMDPDFVVPSEQAAFNDFEQDDEPEGDPGWHLYGFIGHQNRWVFRDFSLDGRLFSSDPHTVAKEPIVNEFQYGFQVRFKEHWGVQALFAHRSNQLKDQRQEHSFGQYMLMYEYPFETY